MLYFNKSKVKTGGNLFLSQILRFRFLPEPDFLDRLKLETVRLETYFLFEDPP